MQRIEPDNEKSDLVSRALYKLDEQNGIYQGQGYSSPKVLVGKHESGIMDIRTHDDDSVRKLLLDNRIKFREHRTKACHFTLVSEEFDKLCSICTRLVEPEPKSGKGAKK